MSSASIPRDQVSVKSNEAKALSLKLIETCRRSKASTEAIITALSVTLGIIIGHTAESETTAREDADIATRTIREAIANQPRSREVAPLRDLN